MLQNASKAMRSNFVRLQRAVFAVGEFEGSGWDGAIEPWQSAIWGAENAQGKMLPLSV